MSTINEFPVCPECGGKWQDYHGLLGYESLQCRRCDLDINDLEVLSATRYTTKVIKTRKF